MKEGSPSFLPGDLDGALGGARPLRVEVRRDPLQVAVYVETGRRVPLGERPRLAAALREVLLPEYPDASVKLVPVLRRPPFGAPAEELVLEAWEDVKVLAREERPGLGGVLEHARVRVVDDRLELEFPSDALRDVARQAGGEALLGELVRRETGLGLRVLLTVTPRPEPGPDRPAPQDGAFDPFAAEIAREDEVLDEPEGLPEPEHLLAYYEEHRARAEEVAAAAESRGALPSGVIRGRPIPPDEPARPLETVREEEPGRLVIEGEVVHVETRETRAGKVMVTFAVTDHSDTLVCKFFRDPDGEPAEEHLAPGTFVRVRGRLVYDSWSRDVNLMAEDIVRAERPVRTDDAPEKRVELHLHTTMSAMDGLVDPEEAVRRAAAWGHEAVAITDHGVTQAFPAAFHVKGLPPGFKVIYGMEAYVVDDATPIVIRPPSVPLADAEWVAVDIETTGFSAIGDDIIEIGAVRIRGGEVQDAFQTFVRPTREISRQVQELTHITPDMVRDAPEPAEALARFLDFAGGAVLVAHNATFDYSFLRYHTERQLGRSLDCPVLDTLVLARSLLPDLKRHGLADLCRELSIPLENHHRADADARTAALLFLRLLGMVRERHPDVDTVAALNRLTRHMNAEQLKPHHATLLVQRQHGMKNLYRLVSKSHLDFFHRTPRIPRTLLEELRDGLLVGSACHNGALFQALLRGAPDSELEELAAWYDFLEVQPPSNFRRLIAEGQVQDEEHLRSLLRRIVELGRRLGKPVVATGDVHFLDPHQEQLRTILKHGVGWREDLDGPCYFRTTAEMLREFEFLGAEEAHEIVVAAPRRVAASIDRVVPVPDRLFAPVVEGAEEAVRDITWARAREVYGDPLPERVRERIDRELQAIIGNGFAVVYYISHLLVKKSHELGYLVGSRGSVGSSLVAWCMGITEVNALPPHYVCPDCHHVEWFADGSVGSGFDLPDKPCPRCGRAKMRKDGQDIPFETFMGFKGDKVPDIDLNFSGEIQSRIQQYSIDLLGGPQQVFKAGTVGTIAEKTAYGMVRAWLEETGQTRREAEIERLARGLTGVRRTTGQHPGGMVVVPVGVEVEEVTPVQYPADDRESGWRTTHYDYHSFESCLLKLDILGHDDPTMLRLLQDMTGIDVTTLPMDDPQVLALFRNGPGEGVDVLGVPRGVFELDLGSIAVPEMGTGFVRRMLAETQPRTFSDLVRISGLSHGTDVWTGNAQKLIQDGVCTLQTVIPTRDDIMLRLMYWGLDPAMAFKIMESVRKGKGLTPEMEEAMEKAGVPEWYRWSCRRIKYMFPKAHAAAYVLSALRIAWFKVHRPREFYAAYFTVRAAGAVDAEILVRGEAAIRQHMEAIRAKGKDASPKEKESLVEYEVALEATLRGIRFARVDLWRSHAVRFEVQADGSLLCPFSALPGIGESAARAITEARDQAPFQSVEDLRVRARLGKNVIDLLQAHGCLRGLPEGNQLVFSF
ncbi:PolC-type DNA polymerase III [Caldinitratiruptor microaerophilus]|uniref:DNA polymerase III PolC-type n=1 Tax=Caldinitratiruptor microaerophilus TaxID=671077 RepID=A0AA35CJ98_9FIRM|nr:PolC-type DNA polymerase III [Caldinitratiruptor microaerophilus]BDG59393.1 DNA polymerase III PolC-type [Caldinitratiruptor microaerophilus]